MPYTSMYVNLNPSLMQIGQSGAKTLIECPAANQQQDANPGYFFDYGLNYNLRGSWGAGVWTPSDSVIARPSRCILIADRMNPMSPVPPGGVQGIDDWCVGCVGQANSHSPIVWVAQGADKWMKGTTAAPIVSLWMRTCLS